MRVPPFASERTATQERLRTTLRERNKHREMRHHHIELDHKLELQLRREFMWSFVIEDFEGPVIGIDFLSHYNLLVGPRNRCLLDAVTHMSTKGQAANGVTKSIRSFVDDIPPAIISISSSRKASRIREGNTKAPGRTLHRNHTRSTRILQI